MRIHVWLRQLWRVSPLRKLSFLTGAVIPALALYWATSENVAADAYERWNSEAP